MQFQMEREKKQEKENARQEQKLSVLNYQIAQLQLDMEATRSQLPVSGSSRVPVGKPKLMRLEDSDDIEHFLTAFERLATVHYWPQQDWSNRLIPLLTGKARIAFVSVDPAHTQDYDKLKEEVFKKYNVNRESYRQHLRALDKSPQELYTCLKDLFCKWVKFCVASKEEILEKMVLEQYLRVLYPEVNTWVKERNPATLAEAAKLVDIYVSAHKGPGVYRYAGRCQARDNSERKVKGIGPVSSSSSQPRPSRLVFQENSRSKAQPGDEAQVVSYNCKKQESTKSPVSAVSL